MKKGYLIVNGFLKSAKFDELYEELYSRANKRSIALELKTNIELMMDASTLRPLSGEALPDFALFWDKDVRLAYELEAAGMRLFNPARAIELADDKALTHAALAGRVNMPKTVFVPLTFPRIGYTDFGFLESIADALGFPFIIKECFGSFGMQVYLAHGMEEAIAIIKSTSGSAVLAQEFVSTSFARDVRIYTVGGKAVASMLRRNTAGDFRANVALGGEAVPYSPSAGETALAETAARALGLDFAGIDLLFGKDGEPLLCEVNSNAHFAGISRATGVDIADRIVSMIDETV